MIGAGALLVNNLAGARCSWIKATEIWWKACRCYAWTDEEALLVHDHIVTEHIEKKC